MNIVELMKINSSIMRLSDEDIAKATNYAGYIEGTRNEQAPQTGDIIEYTTSYGKKYKNAHIDNQNTPTSFAVCLQAYTPFILGIKNGLQLSTSGGRWESVKINKMQYVGKRKKLFCFWRREGWAPAGTLNIEVTVNVWRYVEE